MCEHMMRHATRLLRCGDSLAKGLWDSFQGGFCKGAVRTPGHRHIYDPFGMSSLTLFLPSTIVCYNQEGWKGTELKGFT